MIDSIKFSQEVHQNAVAHGWWDPVPGFGQVIALCHAELSEALEEYRSGRPLEWYACGVDKAVCVGAKCEYYGIKGECDYKKDKPEGVAVELVDCLLRILDALAYMNWEYPIKSRLFAIADKNEFAECIAEMHLDLSNALLAEEIIHETPCIPLSNCAGKIIAWLEANYGENWEELMYRKHEYNKNRPYRHGSKKA